MRRIFFGLLVFTSQAHAGDFFDLYRTAARQDLTLAAARHDLDASLQSVPEARAALLPQITAQGGFSHQTLHETSIAQGYALTDSGLILSTEKNVTSYRYSDRSLSLTLSQTLFDWSEFASLSQAHKVAAAANAVYRSAQEAFIYQFADAYLGVLGATDAMQADIDARAAYEQQLSAAKARLASGFAAITDVRSSQASFDSADAQVIVDRRSVGSAIRALEKMTDCSVGNMRHLKQQIPLILPEPESEDEWAKAASDNNWDVLNAFYGAEVARNQIDVYKGELLPSARLKGQIVREDANYKLGSNSRQGQVGIEVSWNVFQGGLVSARIHEANQTFQGKTSRYELQRRSAIVDTKDAYEAVVTGIASINAYKQSVVSNELNLDAARTGKELGSRTEVDVLNAQQALGSAQKSYYKARYDYLRAILTLKRLAGTLDESDVGAMDRLLVDDPPKDVDR
jgi:outer membrane protein